jgi:hypothetical protein
MALSIVLVGVELLCFLGFIRKKTTTVCQLISKTNAPRPAFKLRPDGALPYDAGTLATTMPTDFFVIHR